MNTAGAGSCRIADFCVTIITSLGTYIFVQQINIVSMDKKLMGPIFVGLWLLPLLVYSQHIVLTILKGE